MSSYPKLKSWIDKNPKRFNAIQKRYRSKTQGRVNERKNYSPEEDELIMTTKESAVVIAKQLKRSHQAIITRKYTLKKNANKKD